eukprot:m.694803 g.694803  ORF g.694803 m.694803 type:complete len:323 (-) comp22885_c0_seq2:181-1149(-)
MDDNRPCAVVAFGATDELKIGGQTDVAECQEIERLKLEIAEKDEMLADLQKKVVEKNSSSIEDLLAETRSCVDRTLKTYEAQIAEKDKQLAIMQALLDDARKQSSIYATSSLLQGNGPNSRKPDRAFMDDYLISILEQKDNLQDELHTLNTAYADVKARLGMAEFEKEKIQAEYRAASRARRAGETGSNPVHSTDGSDRSPTGAEGGSARVSPEGETLEQIRDERDRLAASLAEMTRTVQQLRKQTGAADPQPDSASATGAATSKEAERRRRKEAHRAALTLRDRARLAELEQENKELRMQLKRTATITTDEHAVLCSNGHE